MTEREEIINSLNACMDVHRSGLWSSGCAFCSYAKRSNPKCFMDLTKDAIALLREQPEQKHGHWIPVKLPTGVEAFGYKECTVQEVICSECRFTEDVMASSYSYCPHCGTKMDEEVKQNDSV